MRRFVTLWARVVIALAAGATFLAAGQAQAERQKIVVTGTIEWGVWVDPDGCMHWWADGGLEGYMVTRLDPKTGRAICLKKQTCLVENTDVLFATDSAQLTAEGRRRLNAFFQKDNSFAYVIYGHTDSRASDAYNQRLSERRARSVGQVARANGAFVEREVGFGETDPVAPNNSAANMQKNRRVEVICMRLPGS